MSRAENVYRAPMRSRRGDVDPRETIERALSTGVCGMGATDDERSARRLERFIKAPSGSFVWTRDFDGNTYVGKIIGSWRQDPDGAAVDLVNVRGTDWITRPVDPVLIPAAVAQTFARGGRNFQQIHPDDVEAETAQLWQQLTQ